MEFSYPFNVEDAVIYNKITEEESIDSKKTSETLSKNNDSGATGFFPFGVNSFWHGGIHLKEIETKTKDNKTIKEPVRAIADGKVIAYRIMENSKDGNKVLNSNSFVLVKHKYKSPNGLNFVFYSLYMHLLPWDEYKNDKKLVVPGFFKKTVLKANTDEDGKGLKLKSLVDYNAEDLVIMPRDSIVREIFEIRDNKKTSQPPKSWHKTKYKNYIKVSYTTEIVIKDGKIDESMLSKTYEGYAYKKELKQHGKMWKVNTSSNGTGFGINVRVKSKGEVSGVIPKGVEIPFSKRDEAIKALKNDLGKYLKLDSSVCDNGKVIVSKKYVKSEEQDRPKQFDVIVNTDLKNDIFNVKAGDVIGYCGNNYGENMVHLEIFASEEEKVDGKKVEKNFTDFFENKLKDDQMKKEWNHWYRFGKDTVFYHKKPRVPSGKYAKGSVLEVVNKQGQFPYLNTMKVKKIADVDIDNRYLSRTLHSQNVYINNTGHHTPNLSRIKKFNKQKATISNNQTVRQVMYHSGRRWKGDYLGNNLFFFEVYIQTNLIAAEGEFYIDCKKLEEVGYEYNKNETEILIKNELTRYSENPEILFPESELDKQKASPLQVDKEQKILNPEEVKQGKDSSGKDIIWENYRQKIDGKDGWLKKSETEKLKNNYHNHDEFFHKIKLKPNDQLINNICESPKLIHELEKCKLEKLKAKEKELKASAHDPEKKAAVAVKKDVTSQSQSVESADKKKMDKYINDSKILKKRIKDKTKLLKSCVPYCPTEWSSKLHENDKLKILKQYWHFEDADVKRLILELQRFEFWESVSADGRIPKDGEKLFFFHPIKFVEHMMKLQTIFYATSISEAGKMFIKKEEHFEEYSYDDTKEKDLESIGWGHQLSPSERLIYGSKKKEITKEGKGSEWFNQDIKKFENYINKMVNVPLTQNQFDALVCFIYNIGPGSVKEDTGFVTSTTRKELNKGNYEAAADAILLWVKNPTLKGRRKRERELFLKP